MHKTLFALSVVLSLMIAAAVSADQPPIMQNKFVVEQISHDLLTDAAKWGMPAVSFLANKNAFAKDFGVEVGTVVYWSKPFGSEVKILTPNDTSLYFTVQLEVDEPVVIEIPPTHQSGLRFFGTIMNIWQTPIEDVGQHGFDKGKGGKYYITPAGYKGAIPADVIHRESNTRNVVAGFRVTPKSFSDDDLAAAAAYGKTMKVYPVSDSKETKFFDVFGKHHNPLPPYEGEAYFKLLYEVISTEPMLEKDKRFHEILAKFGISADKKFVPLPVMDSVVKRVRSDNRKYMRRDMGVKMFPESNWQLPVDLIVEAGSQFTYQTNSEYHWQRRGMTFSWACWAPKYLGAATFYTHGQFDEKMQVLHGDNIYKLTVPANVPARQFWSVTVYSQDTCAFYDDVHTVALNSLQSDLKANNDGTVNVYFAAELPKGVNHGNWVPTKKGTEWFTLFRWYGPQPELFNGSWTLGNIIKQ